MPGMSSYYLTTPIYYVNDRPHIGHVYTTLLADVLARFQRLFGRQVFFLTGNDEHAEKVVTTAAERGLSTMQWADQNAAAFQAVFGELDLQFDDFIRTTQDRHKSAVTRYIRTLQERGDVYLGDFEGWYDVNAEAYVTETKAKETNFLSENGKPLVRRKERNYYFRLSAFQQWLTESITSGAIAIEPEARRNEVLGRLREGLDDVPISRPVTDDPATQFGIRMPDDPTHRIYVWIDALFNYLSAVDTPERRPFWPPAVHLMGKEILWFHAVIWPALLKALGEPLPRLIYAHSHYVREGKKMSKSLGNFIDLETIRAYAGRFGTDALRWYLATQGPMFATDADFSHGKFVEVFNADLANGLGNAVSRVGNMCDKYFGGQVPDAKGVVCLPDLPAFGWPEIVAQSVERAIARADVMDLPGALAEGVALVRKVDAYINATEPFKLAKKLPAGPDGKPAPSPERDRLAAILYHCAEALRVAAILHSPAIPRAAARIQQAWHCAPPAGVSLGAISAWGGPHSLKPGQPLVKGEILFMRADPAEPAPQPVY